MLLYILFTLASSVFILVAVWRSAGHYLGPKVWAILARVAPQLNLFAIGLPAKILIGLATLVVALPVILPRLEALIRALPQSMLGLAG